MPNNLRDLLNAPKQIGLLSPDEIAPVLGELIVLLARLLIQATPAPHVPKEDEALRLLTIREAAACLGFRPAHVYELIRQHQFPVIRSGKHLRLLPRDLDEWVRHHRDEGLDAKPYRGLGSPHQ